MGLYDQPSFIDYILEKTNQPQLTYIGHSQGSSQFFVLCSLLPDYCKAKIKGMIGLGPAIYIDNSSANLVTEMARLDLDNIIMKIGINQMLESPEKVNIFTEFICGLSELVCDFADELIADKHNIYNNKARIEVFFSHFPSGVSTKSVHHFAQLIRKKRFIRLDKDEDYPIENISVPLYLFVGAEDRLADPIDTRRLKEKIGGVLKFYEEYENMGHLSFFMTNGKTNYEKDVIDKITEINI